MHPAFPFTQGDSFAHGWLQQVASK